MEVSAALAHRRNFIIQVSTHCAGEIFIWNHSKNNNVSTSYPLVPLTLPFLSSSAARPPSRRVNPFFPRFARSTVCLSVCLSIFLSLSLSLKQRNTQRQIKLKVTQLFSVCAGPMIPPDMMAALRGPLVGNAGTRVSSCI